MLAEYLTGRQDFDLVATRFEASLQNESVPNHSIHIYRHAGLVEARGMGDARGKTSAARIAGEDAKPAVPPSLRRKPDFFTPSTGASRQARCAEGALHRIHRGSRRARRRNALRLGGLDSAAASEGHPRDRRGARRRCRPARRPHRPARQRLAPAARRRARGRRGGDTPEGGATGSRRSRGPEPRADRGLEEALPAADHARDSSQASRRGATRKTTSENEETDES